MIADRESETGRRKENSLPSADGHDSDTLRKRHIAKKLPIGMRSGADRDTLDSPAGIFEILPQQEQGSPENLVVLGRQPVPNALESLVLGPNTVKMKEDFPNRIGRGPGDTPDSMQAMPQCFVSGPEARLRIFCKKLKLPNLHAGSDSFSNRKQGFPKPIKAYRQSTLERFDTCHASVREKLTYVLYVG